MELITKFKHEKNILANIINGGKRNNDNMSSDHVFINALFFVFVFLSIFLN